MSSDSEKKPDGASEGLQGPDIGKEPSRARSYARLMVYAVAVCGVLFIMLGVYQPSEVKKDRPSWDDFQAATKNYQKSQNELLELIQKRTGQDDDKPAAE